MIMTGLNELFDRRNMRKDSDGGDGVVDSIGVDGVVDSGGEDGFDVKEATNNFADDLMTVALVERPQRTPGHTGKRRGGHVKPQDRGCWRD